MVGRSYREPRVFKVRRPLGQCLLTCPETPHPQQVSREERTELSRDWGARLSAWSRCNLFTVACKPFTMSINVVSCVCSGDLVVAADTRRVGSVAIPLFFSATLCAVKLPPKIHLPESRPYPSSRPPPDC